MFLPKDKNTYPNIRKHIEFLVWYLYYIKIKNQLQVVLKNPTSYENGFSFYSEYSGNT